MSLYSLLNDKSFEEYINYKINLLNIKTLTSDEIIKELEPTFKEILRSMTNVMRETLCKSVDNGIDPFMYSTTVEIALAIREPSNTTSIWCKKLYDVGIFKRRKVSDPSKQKSKSVAYEYKCASDLFIKWLVKTYNYQYEQTKDTI